MSPELVRGHCHSGGEPHRTPAVLKACGLSFRVSGRQSLECEPHSHEVATSSHVGIYSVFLEVGYFFI